MVQVQAVRDLVGLESSSALGAPVTVDILPGIDGVDFDDAWGRKVEAVIDPKTGLTAFVISKKDLIASKIAAGGTAILQTLRRFRKLKQAVWIPKGRNQPNRQNDGSSP
jgi:hypothetical protein